tara:strand:- start:213 stop:491 length:279 start_codon:yes stop_codon:yes gene_type:complete
MEDEVNNPIYEIYCLDSFVYPHERRYHSHVQFINADSIKGAMDSLSLYVKLGGTQHYDVKEVNEDYVLKRMAKLELQLETCRQVLHNAKSNI